MDPIIAVGAVASALKIVDSLTGQWDRVFKKKAEADIQQDHGVKAVQVSPDTITISSKDHPTDTITAADLAKLSSNDRALIKSLEESMQRQYELWVAVYPSRNASSDPVVNAQVDRRLKDIAKIMCDDLGRIFGFLDLLGKYLEDHYSNFRYVCFEMNRQSGPE